MKLFEKTMGGIDSYLHNLNDANHFDGKRFNESLVKASLNGTSIKSPLIIDFQESDLNRYFSPSPLRFERISIGDHPDFISLGHNETAKQYAVSFFMDIKGSTRLIEIVNDLEELRRLKDTILNLAIRVCNYFGGHVQRLQGDGIFVLFTRKGFDPNDAMIGALNASSVLTYFIKHEFEPAVIDMGIEKSISIRTGIDYGATNDVLWSRYGIPECNELTTTSLHTDLAAKLQQKASSNGIIIGDNIKQALDLEKFISTRTYFQNGLKKDDKTYNVTQNIKYPMWVFNWEKFLLSYDCVTLNNTKLVFKKPHKKLRCIIESKNIIYPENSYALEKNEALRFDIIDMYGNILNNYPKKKIEWKIINTGKEAQERNYLEASIEGNDGYAVSVVVNSAFLGHHKIQCQIKNGMDKETLEFNVFVNSGKLLASSND